MSAENPNIYRRDTDILRRGEGLPVTPRDLYADNHSLEADRRREAWNRHKADGNLTVVWSCGDARVIIPNPETTVSIRSIATGSPSDAYPYTRLMESPGVKNIIILPHFDGETVKPGEEPTGCGGLGEKKVQETKSSKEVSEGNSVVRYVKQRVKSSDVLLQACISATITNENTSKNVLAAAQDHRDGTIIPIAAFSDRGRRTISAINLRHLFQGQYDPKIIYQDGIPSLSEDEIPEEFRAYLTLHRKNLEELYKVEPDLVQLQKTQNPTIMALSTDPRPFEVRFPALTASPNTLFKLSVPRTRIDSRISIDDQSLNDALDQTEYPVAHFSNLNTIYIETGDFDRSKRVADQLILNEWVHDWINEPSHQIIAAQTRDGIVSRISTIY